MLTWLTWLTWLILCNKPARAGGLHTNGLIFAFFFFCHTSKRIHRSSARADRQRTQKANRLRVCVWSNPPLLSHAPANCGVCVAHLDEETQAKHLRLPPNSLAPLRLLCRFRISFRQNKEKELKKKLRFSQLQQ